MPFGSPVVPEVNAIRQTSSLAVSQAVKALIARLRHHGFETVRAAPIDDALELRREGHGLFHLVGKPRVAQREFDLRLADRVGQFLGAQQRHGGDHHAARLDDREIARNRHRGVRRAHQHAIARHHAEIAREHIGDAVDALGKLR